MAEAIKMGGGGGRIKNAITIKPLAYEETVKANTLVELFQSKVFNENTTNSLITGTIELIFIIPLSGNKEVVIYTVNSRLYGIIVSYTDTGITKSTAVDLGVYTSSGGSQNIFTLACCASTDKNHIYLIQSKNEVPPYSTAYYRIYITEININNMTMTVGASTKIHETTAYQDSTFPYLENSRLNLSFCNLIAINSDKLMFSYWAKSSGAYQYQNIIIISLINGAVSTIGTIVSKNSGISTYNSFMLLNPINLNNNTYVLFSYQNTTYNSYLSEYTRLQNITVNDLTVTFGELNLWKPEMSGSTSSDKSLTVSNDYSNFYTFSVAKISTNKFLLLVSTFSTIPNNIFSGGIYCVIFDYSNGSMTKYVNNVIDVILPKVSGNTSYLTAGVFVNEDTAYCVVNNKAESGMCYIISFKINSDNTITDVRRSLLSNDVTIISPKVYSPNIYNNKIRGYLDALPTLAHTEISVTSFNLDFFVKQAKISTKCDGLLKTKATLTSRGRCELLTNIEEV